MEKEYRFNAVSSESDANGRHISGRAICFDSPSKYIGFREIIKPSACTQEFLNEQDILMLFNHNDSRGILARWNKGVGNLKLDVRSDGLYYEFDALNTALGDEVIEYIKSGIINGVSFCFIVDDDGEEWERSNDGEVVRTISKFYGLYDVSLVVDPAYPDTTFSCRSFDEFKEKEERNAEIQKNNLSLLEEINAL